MRIFKVYWPLALAVLTLVGAVLYFSDAWGGLPQHHS